MEQLVSEQDMFGGDDNGDDDDDDEEEADEDDERIQNGKEEDLGDD
jgi:hypothetical protein